MAHDYPDAEPESCTALFPQDTIRHDGWTTRKQLAFLRALAATQSVAQAARAVGMSRQSAYKLRARLQNGPFGAGWRMATRGARSAVLEAAVDRAINGVETPHYWQGELVGTSRRYDERLTALLLAPGVLGEAGRAVPCAESEYAQTDLARLLDRIENGPPEWLDFETERDFLWNDTVENEEADAAAAPDSEGWPEEG
jgi:hypothetical protein